jgi:virulence factor Mce-like protein
METRSPTRDQIVVPLIFALLCVGLSIFAWRTFDGTTPLQPERYTFNVRLPGAAGLLDGADVRMSGVVIGQVTAVRRSGTAARITAALDRRYAPLRSDAHVIARSKSLLGEAYLEVAPGSPGAPRLPEGGILAPGQAKPTQQLADVLDTFTPRARADLRAALRGLSRGVAGRGQDLNDTLGQAQQGTAALASLVGKLDVQRVALGRLVSSSGAIFDTLGEQQAALGTTIRAGEQIFRATASRDRELRSTVRALPPFLRRLRSAAAAIDGASGVLDRAARSMQPAAAHIAPLLRNVRRYSPAARALLEDLPPVLDSGRRTLPAVERIARAAGPALVRSYPAFRELIPLMQLVSADREEIIAVLGNVASLLNGRMYGPADRPVAYGTGVPTIWNEVIGGWIRKLPTNRANPYLKPGALRSLADEGVVHAYDCRQTGNPLYLPPTGTGAPPCRTQGPWTFQGRTSYYPQLQPAAP